MKGLLNPQYKKPKDLNMDNVMNKGSNVISKGKDLAGESSVVVTKALNLKASDISAKVFDNIVWVFLLVFVLIIGFFTYFLLQSMNIDLKIQEMDKLYNEGLKQPKIANVDEESDSKNEIKFDEIDVNKHTLCDVYINSSAKTFLSNKQILDYVSKDVFFHVIKLGARYVELDIFVNGEGALVVSSGLFTGNWRLTLNEIYLEEFIKEIPEKVFKRETISNYRDPFILFLKLNIKKEYMNLVHKIITSYMSKYLLTRGYSTGEPKETKKNPLELTLKELEFKILLLTDGMINNTKLTEIINLRVGPHLKRMTYKDLEGLNKDRLEELKNYNQNNLTIVVPNPSIYSINSNPTLAWDNGCQIVALNHQRLDDNVMRNIAKFREKSFTLKPFEFTRHSNIPQTAYDKKKLLYYNNYEDTDTLKTMTRIVYFS